MPGFFQYADMLPKGRQCCMRAVTAAEGPLLLPKTWPLLHACRRCGQRPVTAAEGPLLLPKAPHFQEPGHCCMRCLISHLRSSRLFEVGASYSIPGRSTVAVLVRVSLSMRSRSEASIAWSTAK